MTGLSVNCFMYYPLDSPGLITGALFNQTNNKNMMVTKNLKTLGNTK